MQILPKLQCRFGENIGVRLSIQFPNIEKDIDTFLTDDEAAASSALAVVHGDKFSTGEFIVIGGIGTERAEIIRIHTSTTPTVGTITLNSNTQVAHNRGDIVERIPYDQIQIERSTDGGSSYSTLATISLRADSLETVYHHTSGASTDYYRVKFKNSTSSDLSQASDGIIATGYVANSVGALIRQALVDTGEEIDNVITKEFLYGALNEGRAEIDNDENILRWPFRNVWDYNAGSVIPGQNTLTLPTNLREPSTAKNILSVRIGRSKTPVTYKDKRGLNEHYEGVAHTTLNGAVADTDTEIDLTASGDFDESGVITIAAATVAGTLDEVDYTGNTEASNQLTGVTNIASGGHSNATDVWQHAGFGTPLYFTVDNGSLIFSQPFDDDLAGEIIWMDYYSELSDIDSDADLLDEPFYKIYLPYLRYRIRKFRDESLKREDSDDWKDWIQKRKEIVNKNYEGQRMRIRVDVP